MSEPIPERRLKVFRVDERALLGFLECWRESTFLQLPTGPRIPPGCKIVRIWHDNYCRSLCVMLAHDSFPECPDGSEVARDDWFIEYEALEWIPVADHFRPPMQVLYYPAGKPSEGVLAAIERMGEQRFKNNALPSATLNPDDGFYWDANGRPVGFESSFPPPAITALERWLTVANIEKYTVENSPAREMLKYFPAHVPAEG